MQPQIALHASRASAHLVPRSLHQSARQHAQPPSGRHQSQQLVARSSSASQGAVVDQDLLEELNLVSNRTLEAMSCGQESHAQALSAELLETLGYLQQEGDAESCRFLRVLRGLLAHRVPAEAAELDGMYAAAVNRILNQVSGSEWKLTEEGTAAPEEPSFSSWEDVFGGKKKGKREDEAKENSQPPDTLAFYRRLGVGSDAEPAEIKAAYRRLALQLHPDVSAAPDASARFAELSEAYDVLSNATSRALYDRFGPDMASQAGAEAGRGNAREAWAEFKPHVRQNKHTRARAVSQPGGDSPAAGDSQRQPQVGDVVEYPLRPTEIEEYADGRTHGVGLLVGRNMDRGDVAKLPADRLSLCEVEPLRQEEAESKRWMADELGLSSFARLEEMRVIPVAAFDSRKDVWTITVPLSPGCGGPPLPEEIIY